MTAATMESHHSWSKSGIWEMMICATPNAIVYGLLDILQGSFPPLACKQLDRSIALFDQIPTKSPLSQRLQRSTGTIDWVQDFYIHSYIILMEDAMVQPMASPKKFSNWISKHILPWTPPDKINKHESRVHFLVFQKQPTILLALLRVKSGKNRICICMQSFKNKQPG